MRFKKLRFSVAIAMIFFIIIAGDIVITGKLMGKFHVFDDYDDDDYHVQSIAMVDPKRITVPDMTTTTSTDTADKPVETSAVKIIEPAPVKRPGATITEVATPLPDPVVEHTTRKTRAS